MTTYELNLDNAENLDFEIIIPDHVSFITPIELTHYKGFYVGQTVVPTYPNATEKTIKYFFRHTNGGDGVCWGVEGDRFSWDNMVHLPGYKHG